MIINISSKMIKWFILFLLTITRYSNLDQQCGVILTGQEWILYPGFWGGTHVKTSRTFWSLKYGQSWSHTLTDINELIPMELHHIHHWTSSPSPIKDQNQSQLLEMWSWSRYPLWTDIETHLFDNSSVMVPSVSTDLWGDRYPHLTTDQTDFISLSKVGHLNM